MEKEEQEIGNVERNLGTACGPATMNRELGNLIEDGKY